MLVPLGKGVASKGYTTALGVPSASGPTGTTPSKGQAQSPVAASSAASKRVASDTPEIADMREKALESVERQKALLERAKSGDRAAAEALGLDPDSPTYQTDCASLGENLDRMGDWLESGRIISTDSSDLTPEEREILERLNHSNTLRGRLEDVFNAKDGRSRRQALTRESTPMQTNGATVYVSDDAKTPTDANVDSLVHESAHASGVSNPGRGREIQNSDSRWRGMSPRDRMQHGDFYGDASQNARDFERRQAGQREADRVRREAEEARDRQPKPRPGPPPG